MTPPGGGGARARGQTVAPQCPRRLPDGTRARRQTIVPPAAVPGPGPQNGKTQHFPFQNEETGQAAAGRHACPKANNRAPPPPPGRAAARVPGGKQSCGRRSGASPDGPTRAAHRSAFALPVGARLGGSARARRQTIALPPAGLGDDGKARARRQQSPRRGPWALCPAPPLPPGGATFRATGRRTSPGRGNALFVGGPAEAGNLEGGSRRKRQKPCALKAAAKRPIRQVGQRGPEI